MSAHAPLSPETKKAAGFFARHQRHLVVVLPLLAIAAIFGLLFLLYNLAS